MSANSKKELIEQIKRYKREIQRFGVKNIGIFGSFARDETNSNSDVDVVVEFKKGTATFKNVAGLCDFLESILNRPVDILTPDGIETIRIKHIREQIKKELEYV